MVIAQQVTTGLITGLIRGLTTAVTPSARLLAVEGLLARLATAGRG